MAGEAQFTAQAFGAFAHADEAEVPSKRREDVARFEAMAVVDDAQVELAILGMQFDPDLAGARMLKDVGDGFLRDAQKVLLEFLREAVLRAGDIDMDFDAGAGGPDLRSGVE